VNLSTVPAIFIGKMDIRNRVSFVFELEIEQR
jgi:hypothetical protein